MRGKFITLEGSEGVGKTTNLQFIQSRLESKGIELLVTREPGGTPLAEEIREMLLAKRDENFDVTAELLLMFAARSQHLNQVIKPAIEKGTWVLCDRFTDATFAYQGYGRNVDLEQIETLEKLVQGDVQPDATFLLDIDVEVGLERARARAALDRFEDEKISFFERVREGYLARANKFSDRFYIVDAGQPLNDVQRDIDKYLEKLLSTS